MTWMKRWGALWCRLLGRHGTRRQVTRTKHTITFECVRCGIQVEAYEELL